MGKGATISRIRNNQVTDRDLQIAHWIVRLATAIDTGANIWILIQIAQEMGLLERALAVIGIMGVPVLTEVVMRTMRLYHNPQITPAEQIEMRREIQDNPLFQIPAPNPQNHIVLPAEMEDFATGDVIREGDAVVRLVDGRQPNQYNTATRATIETYMMTPAGQRHETTDRQRFTSMTAGVASRGINVGSSMRHRW